MLRALSAEEVAFVSGGMMEDADDFDDGSGSGDSDFGDGSGYDDDDYTSGQVVSQDVPSPTDANGDIIVTATADQVEDARIAYGEAQIIVNSVEYGGMAAGAAIGATDWAVAAKIFGGVAAGSTTLVTADNKQSITNSVADAIYYKNRADPYGTYDAIP